MSIGIVLRVLAEAPGRKKKRIDDELDDDSGADEPLDEKPVGTEIAEAESSEPDIEKDDDYYAAMLENELAGMGGADEQGAEEEDEPDAYECPDCGADVKENDKECWGCGEELTVESED